MFPDPAAWLTPAQLLGYLAAVTTATAFLMPDDRRLKLTLALGSVVWTGHYLVLGAHTAAAVLVLIAARQAISVGSASFPPLRRHALAAGFIALFALATALTWQGPVSLLPLLAAVNATYALFYLGGVRMRVQLALGDASWLANGLWFGSIGQVVTSTVILAANALTIWRLRRG